MSVYSIALSRLVNDGSAGADRTVASGTSQSPAVSRANSKGHGNNRSSPASASAASSERNLALVLLGIVLVFMVCHSCRIVTTKHEPKQFKDITRCKQVG